MENCAANCLVVKTRNGSSGHCRCCCIHMYMYMYVHVHVHVHVHVGGLLYVHTDQGAEQMV